MNTVERMMVEVGIRILFRKVSSPKNQIDEVIMHMARMLVYSAIKMRANSPLLYSTLNPDTSSDSPSAKSKGVRLVSARLVINHNRNIGGIRHIRGVNVAAVLIRSIDLRSIRADTRIRAILTS
jgi:hypothetical protein